jgi:predicted  nucleic acid-binding Zn-ribbon protein
VDQLDKLSEQENKLLDQITKSKTRTRRLRKQRRLLLKKMRDLGDRETQNIFKLEVDEILSEIPVKPVEILNLFSPRSFSFLNPALLDFFNRILAEPLGS